MWPFKSVKAIDEPKDPSPCGNDEKHYYWQSGDKMPCPFCILDKKIALEAKQEQQRKEKELQQQEELADLIAEKVFNKLKNKE